RDPRPRRRRPGPAAAAAARAPAAGGRGLCRPSAQPAGTGHHGAADRPARGASGPRRTGPAAGAGSRGSRGSRGRCGARHVPATAALAGPAFRTPHGARCYPAAMSLFPIRSLLVAALLGGCALAASARAAGPQADALFARLAQAAPSLDREVLSLATRAVACSRRQPGSPGAPSTLSVIDFSRPSTEPRLWVFDLASHDLLFEELVAHGRNTGGNLATEFSNRSGSNMSSL